LLSDISAKTFLLFIFSYSGIVTPKENPNESSQTQLSSTIDESSVKESSQDLKTTNTDDDTKLHVARYHKTETAWDDLLTQVCSSPMKEKDKCSFLFTMMIVRVPPSSFLSSSFSPSFTK
jgi:hypothetical protein